MTTQTNKVLEFIPDMAQELPALVMGEPTTVDRLMLAASICGWVMDYPTADTDTWGRALGDRETYAVITETGVEDGKGFVLTVEWKNGAPMRALDYQDCTAEELADLGRAFLNAAIAKRQQENTQ